MIYEISSSEDKLLTIRDRRHINHDCALGDFARSCQAEEKIESLQANKAIQGHSTHLKKSKRFCSY